MKTRKGTWVRHVVALSLVSLVSMLAAQAEEPPNFALKWGSEGTGDGQFQYAQRLVVDETGNILVADYYNIRIQKFSPTGTLLMKFTTGWGLFAPLGLAVNAAGEIYITRLSHYVTKYDSNGVFLTAWGGSGSGDGQFNFPSGIAVDGQGNLYVADTDNHRIQKFDSTGNFLAKWGSQGTGNGQFDSPYDVAVDQSGNVYVVERYNHRVQKFTSTGTYLGQWGGSGSGDGQFSNPRGIGLDGQGRVYVADTSNHRIQKFTSDGDFLSKWGTYGTGDGQFSFPYDVAVDPSGAAVYVMDYQNSRVQKFTYPDASSFILWTK